MKKVYVVEGSTGEYSDRTEWPVIAYESEDRAKQHVLNASAEARKILNERQEIGWHETAGKGLKNRFDPGMRMDYTGTFYSYYEVDVITDGETVN